ncbi:MAG TPA: COQ9 family protein [Alphaproteobacteria bacterium]|nr:COQ9 family protein [Alphaproteobacteria bacterium]
MTEPNKKMMAEKDAIVEAALTHVPFDGWSWKALEAAAGSRGPAARQAFPGGLLEAAEHLSDWADRRMTAALKEMDMEPMRLRDRLAAGVRGRLEIFRLHREAVRRIATFLTLPGHKGAALKLTWKTVDAIWCGADDRSHEFSHYTKRGLLAPVYATTVLYWLADDSDGFEDTWDYLDRRLAGGLRILEAKTRMEEYIGKIPSPFRLCCRLRKGLNNGTVRP